MTIVAAVHVRHLVPGVGIGRRPVIMVAHVVHCEPNLRRRIYVPAKV